MNEKNEGDCGHRYVTADFATCTARCTECKQVVDEIKVVVHGDAAKPPPDVVSEAEAFAKLRATPMTNFNRMREADQLERQIKETSRIRDKAQPSPQPAMPGYCCGCGIETTNLNTHTCKTLKPETQPAEPLDEKALRDLAGDIIIAVLTGVRAPDATEHVMKRLRPHVQRPTLTPAQREEAKLAIANRLIQEGCHKYTALQYGHAAFVEAEKRLLGKV